MQYLFLIYHSSHSHESMSVNEHASRQETYRTNDMALCETGYIQHTGNLQSNSLILEVRNNQLSFKTGLVNKPKQELCQYCIVNARDLNEAIWWHPKCPRRIMARSKSEQS